MHRYRALIAALAIALQALDLAVGALGHSHASDHEACAPAASAPEHAPAAGCGHGHCHSAADHEEPRSPPSSPHKHSRGDCSLCRHFSQPVAPLAVTVEISASEPTATVTPPQREHFTAATRPLHPARGPPRGTL